MQRRYRQCPRCRQYHQCPRAAEVEGGCWLTLTASGPSAGGRFGAAEGEGAGDGSVEHRLGEPPSKGVLLAGVVRSNEPTPVWEAHLGTVSEGRRAGRTEEPAARRVRETAKRKDRSEPRQQGQLSLEETNAVVPLGRCRSVRRRGATDHGRYPHVLGLEAVIPPRARRLAGETSTPESCPEPVTRPVARENAPGPVAPVRRRREPHHGEASGRVAETRERFPPVLLTGESCPAKNGHLFPPLNEAGATAARDDLLVELLRGPLGHDQRIVWR